MQHTLLQPEVTQNPQSRNTCKAGLHNRQSQGAHLGEILGGDGGASPVLGRGFARRRLPPRLPKHLRAVLADTHALHGLALRHPGRVQLLQERVALDVLLQQAVHLRRAQQGVSSAERDAPGGGVLWRRRTRLLCLVSSECE